MSHKIEHNGAKNGGGAWERRTEAKRMSRKARRAEAKRMERGSFVRFIDGSQPPAWGSIDDIRLT
jgi:hypothetical protein